MNKIAHVFNFLTQPSNCLWRRIPVCTRLSVRFTSHEKYVKIIKYYKENRLEVNKLMEYREFGKTGLQISALGFGTMRLPEVCRGGVWQVDDEIATPLIRAAYDAGINYYDTAWGYCHEDGQRAVGRAIAPFRENIYLSTKLPLWNLDDPQDFWKYLMTALERLDTGYIDFYHFHALNRKLWDKVRELKLLDKMERARSLGLIRHVSFSFHDDPALLEEIVDTGAFDSLLCQYNLIDRTNEKAMAYAKAAGVGVVVMGPLGGGNIAQGGADFLARFSSDAESAAELALRFVLGNSNVTCALSGMASQEELVQNLAYAARAQGSAREEWAALAGTSDQIRALGDLYCTGCGYCEVCPKGILPASVFKAYNMKTVWGLNKAAARRISSFGSEGASALPEACVRCGACAARCPQKIDIPAELARTWAALRAHQ